MSNTSFDSHKGAYTVKSSEAKIALRVAKSVTGGAGGGWQSDNVNPTSLNLAFSHDINTKRIKWSSLAKVVAEQVARAKVDLATMVKDGIQINLAKIDKYEPIITVRDGWLEVELNFQALWMPDAMTLSWDDVEEILREKGYA